VKSREASIDRQTVYRLFTAVKLLAESEHGWTAKLMFAGLVALLFGVNSINVLNNYVGRDFMTAIEHRNKAEFVRLAFVYLGVFASSTLMSVFAKVMEERLGLLWRTFITKRFVGSYLENGTYYRLGISGSLENPDQRIAEDVHAFTTTTLSFVVILLNGSVTIVAFSGVVWSISPTLFGVAVVYAACGSYLAILLGRPLVKLNYSQLDKDAYFRTTLIHVRENAEPLLMAHREGQVANNAINLSVWSSRPPVLGLKSRHPNLL
jgi:putative ATP-binding cassette transporter